jgi:hypothetical protein
VSGGTDPTVEGQVKIGDTTNAAAALDNLKAAVNHDAGHGTLYFAAAAHTQFVATANTDTEQTFGANVGDYSGQGGNGLTVSETSGTLSFSPTTLVGGLDGVLVNPLVAQVALTNDDETGLVQNLSLVAEAEVVSGGNAVILTIKTGAAGTTDVKYVDIDYSVI